MDGFTLPQANLLASIWTLTAVALFLTVGRLILRHIILARFYWDDLFALLSFILLVASNILYTIYLPYAYRLQAASDGTGPPLSQEESMKIEVLLLKLVFPVEGFFWTILFCVKFSFLFLYRLMLRGSGSSFRLGWSVMIFTLLSYGVCLIGWIGQCGYAQDAFDLNKCFSPHGAYLREAYLWIQLSFNVFTDFLVIALPLSTLWGLHLRSSQKIAVGAVFSLALIILAFEVLRAVKSYTLQTFYTILYTSLETEVAVIVSMLPSYRAIVSNNERHRKHRRDFLSFITLRSSSTEHGSRTFVLQSFSRGVGENRTGSDDESVLERRAFPALKSNSASETSAHGIVTESKT